MVIRHIAFDRGYGNKILTQCSAIDITGEGIKAIMRQAEPGLTEYQVQSILDHTYRMHGAQWLGFRIGLSPGDEDRRGDERAEVVALAGLVRADEVFAQRLQLRARASPEGMVPKLLPVRYPSENRARSRSVAIWPSSSTWTSPSSWMVNSAS